MCVGLGGDSFGVTKTPNNIPHTFRITCSSIGNSFVINALLKTKGQK